jgi:CTP:molybdopterin cytidylyltransferase MocA
MPLIGYSIKAAKNSGLGRVMVVGGQPFLKTAGIAAQMGATDFVINKNPHKGMGRSLSLAAARALKMKAPCLVVMLADMPLVDPLVLAGVCEKTWQVKCGLAAARVGEKWCHPVGFMARHFNELADLSLDKGGRELVKRYQGKMGLVQAAPESMWDIDSRQDLIKVESYLKSKGL